MISGDMSALPPDWRVLVVGYRPDGLAKKYGDRVIWLNHWEMRGNTKIPGGAKAVCVSHRVHGDNLEFVRKLAEVSQVERFEVEKTEELFIRRIRAWLDKPGQQTRAEVPVSVGPLVPATPQEIAVASGKLLIPVNRLKPLKDQARSYFSKLEMRKLIDSIRAIGLQNPVVVKKLDDDPDYDYELIEGERRLRAHKVLGLLVIWAVVDTVKNSDDQYLRSFVANLARDGYTPLDTARALMRSLKSEGFAGQSRADSIRQLAEMCGKSEVWVYQHLRLLTLPEEVQKMLEPDEDTDRSALPFTMGTFLCTVDDRDIRLAVCKAVVEEKLSVAKAKSLARKLAKKVGLDPNFTKRTPNKDFRILSTYLRVTRDGVDGILDMHHRTIDQVFENRDLKDRLDARKQVEELIKRLSRLRDELKVKAPVKQ